MKSIKEIISKIPETPGVYQYFDKDGNLLYIGKAKNLKKRVKSYWRMTPSLHPNPELSPRILKMLKDTAYLEYIIVDSEADALILENSLIKQLKPKYNILLRDDKTYPYIYIDKGEKFPRFEITRKAVKGKNIKYYGPFPNGAKAMLDAIYFLYPLVQKKGSIENKKACLFYQIKRCLAPCEGKISEEEYKKIVDLAEESIKDTTILLKKLNSRMLKLAEEERFEEAGKVRDQIKAISDIKIHSDMDLANSDNIDIFTIDFDSKRGIVLKLFLRDGKVSAQSYNFFRDSQILDINLAYRQAILSFYTKESPAFSSTILIADDIENRDEIEDILKQRVGRRIKIIYPKRGSKAKLINIAKKNAQELLKRKDNSQDEVLEEKIATLLNLERIPVRVEIFDNSHIAGTNPVGAMVVYDNGHWDKESYRRYKLSSKDEYHQMEETLKRRIAKFEDNPPPDLWILDGGETLRSLAKELLKKNGINLSVVAIAKEKIDAKAHRAKGSAKDIIYSDRAELKLDSKDKRLQWFQKLRDEAHRFAISYHRKKKLRSDMKSSILEKKGIGKATLKKLLDYFGTFEAIEKASYEEIKSVVGDNIAKKLDKNPI